MPTVHRAAVRAEAHYTRYSRGDRVNPDDGKVIVPAALDGREFGLVLHQRTVSERLQKLAKTGFRFAPTLLRRQNPVISLDSFHHNSGLSTRRSTGSSLEDSFSP